MSYMGREHNWEVEMRTTKKVVDDIIYCALGVKEENSSSNYGEEKKWLRQLYNACNEYLDDEHDLKGKKEEDIK